MIYWQYHMSIHFDSAQSENNGQKSRAHHEFSFSIDLIEMSENTCRGAAEYIIRDIMYIDECVLLKRYPD